MKIDTTTYSVAVNATSSRMGQHEIVVIATGSKQEATHFLEYIKKYVSCSEIGGKNEKI